MATTGMEKENDDIDDALSDNVIVENILQPDEAEEELPIRQLRRSTGTSFRKQRSQVYRRSTKVRYDQSSGSFIPRTQRITILDKTKPARPKWRLFWKPSSELSHADDGHRHFRILSLPLPSRRRLANALIPRMKYDNWIADYLRWTFRTTFLNLGVSIALAYLTFVAFFSVLVFAANAYNPDCFSGDRFDFMDAFHLTWTTFATVGYGVLYPELAAKRGIGDSCILSNAVMAYISFSGVLFGGITGAVIFSKIARMQTVAQIAFSEPICIRYGSGLLAELADNDEEMSSESAPFPLLEFRILNQLSHIVGGEIVDASIGIMADTPFRSRDTNFSPATQSIIFIPPDEEIRSSKGDLSSNLSKVAIPGKLLANTIGSTIAKVHSSVPIGSAIAKMQSAVPKIPFVRTTGASSVIQQLKRHISTTSMPDGNGGDEFSDRNDEEIEAALEEAFEARFLERLERKQKQMLSHTNASKVFVEGDGKLFPLSFFQRLDVETDTHPFFKRAWLIRHVIDESSPLLSDEARLLIEKNNGVWPTELNNLTSIRKHVSFNNLIVRFKGTSQATGSTVYGFKVYKFSAVNIGYEFAPLIQFVEKNEKVTIDKTLLNSIKVQSGGGDEPLNSCASRKDSNDKIANDHHSTLEPIAE